MTDTEISKYMALLLRHKPESAGLVLDEHGWADVTGLLACIAENKEPISFDRLCEIVIQRRQKQNKSEPGTFDKGRCRTQNGYTAGIPLSRHCRKIYSVDRRAGTSAQIKAVCSSVKGYRNCKKCRHTAR